ncbi:MAG: LON peptidase substrate-binding domain-containing protein [Candidatus Thiodiazotropha sp.]
MQSPFVPAFDHLPTTLPIFPLEGAVVMPGAQLPLNIFEPRYLNMVQDALASHHLIGMIQPETQTGCAGRISAYQETTDGRIEIVLSGVCRFDILQELATTRGYRMVVPDWSRFATDYEFPRFDKRRQQRHFFTELDHYLQAKELEIEEAIIHKLPFARLLNVLTTLLPLHHHDKQAIIETVSFDERYKLLISQFELAGNGSPSHMRH